MLIEAIMKTSNILLYFNFTLKLEVLLTVDSLIFIATIFKLQRKLL